VKIPVAGIDWNAW